MNSTENTPRRVATLEEQVKFALVCIKYAENRKVNWENVGKEFSISKGAAAKRYERLIKAYDMSPASAKVAGTKRSAAEADGSDDEDNTDNTVTNSPLAAATKSKAAKATGAAAKKRKTSGKTFEEGDTTATAEVGEKTTKDRKTTMKAKTDTKADGDAKNVKTDSQMSLAEGEIKEDAETKESGAVKDLVHNIEA